MILGPLINNFFDDTDLMIDDEHKEQAEAVLEAKAAEERLPEGKGKTYDEQKIMTTVEFILAELPTKGCTWVKFWYQFRSYVFYLGAFFVEVVFLLFAGIYMTTKSVEL